MECELVRLAGVPIGLVTSALFYSTDSAGSAGQEEPEVQFVHMFICSGLSRVLLSLYIGTLGAGERGADSRVSHWATAGLYSLIQGPVCSMHGSVYITAVSTQHGPWRHVPDMLFLLHADSLHAPRVAVGDILASSAAYQTSYEGLLKVVRDPNTPR